MHYLQYDSEWSSPCNGSNQEISNVKVVYERKECLLNVEM